VNKETKTLEANDFKPSWQAVVVALGFMALVGVLYWRATETKDFKTEWLAVGPIVGVLVGAVPSYFFHRDAKNASVRVEALAGAASPEAVAYARASAPRAFARDWGYGVGAANVRGKEPYGQGTSGESES
jgi:hypothetical protein